MRISQKHCEYAKLTQCLKKVIESNNILLSFVMKELKI